MDEDQLIYEISVLLNKVTAAEDLLARAELYFDLMEPVWEEEIHGREIAGAFQDMLERKKELIDFEWERIRRMGQAIAAGRNFRWEDTI